MNVALKMSQQIALLAAIAPASVAPGDVSTPWLSASDFASALLIVEAGAIGGTLDAKIEQATDAAGAGAKDVADKAITQTSDDGEQMLINLKAVDLDLENDFSHFRLTITVGGSAALVSAVVLGGDGRYEPASDGNAASVTEIV